MEYKEEIRILMTYYPRSNLDEYDALHHLFFVNGNGYEWVDGELVCDTEEAAKAHYDRFVQNDLEKAKELAEHYKDSMADWSFYGKTLEETRQKEIKYRMSWIKDPDEEGCCWFLLPDGRIGRKIYPICQYAQILHVPDDVKPDWLEAAFKAIEMAESDLFHCTDRDKEWLVKAKEQLSRFK